MASQSTSPLLQLDGPIARIVLNRPEHRNRLTQDDLGTLMQHLDQVERDASVRVLVISATVLDERPVFSSGFNMQDHACRSQVPTFGAVMDRLESLDRVTLCALGGSVYGGATDFALACDFAIGVKGMELRLPAAAIGLHYHPGGLSRWVSRVGLPWAKQIVLAARTVKDVDLHGMGYIQQLVEASALGAAVQALTAQLLALAPRTQSLLKRSLNEVARGDHDPVLLEGRHQESLAGAEFAEGCRAFAARRAPDFGAL
jgi:enoyl-CoA hydratase/carnithine racemase